MAQLRKLLGELSHEELRTVLPIIDERLDEPEVDEDAPAATKDAPVDPEKVYTLEDLTEDFAAATEAKP